MKNIIDKYAKRILRNDGIDTPPNCHFYDEIEKLIHEIISGYGNILFNNDKLINDPSVAKLSSVFLQLYGDYYYDYPFIPTHVENAIKLLNPVNKIRHQIFYEKKKLRNTKLEEYGKTLENMSFEDIEENLNKLKMLTSETGTWDEREYLYVD